MIPSALSEALERVATSGTLLVASDYDGTLAPLVDEPSEAVPHARALDALRSVSGRSRTKGLIVSGRSVEALSAFIGDTPTIALVGNHGAGAPRRPGTDAAIRNVSAALAAIASDIEGVLVEPKPTGAALHYRHATRKAEAADRARAVAREFSARTIEGKMVVEVTLGTGDKGTALEAVRRETAADHVVFLGDDVTDEAAFLALRGLDVGVKVGAGPTAALHRVGDPDGVADTLEALDGMLAAIGR